MKTFVLMTGYISAVIVVSVFLIGCGNSTLENNHGDENQVDEFTVFRAEDGLTDSWITDIVVDYARGGVWCATMNGISFYSHADSVWTAFGAEYDIPDMNVTSLTVDFTGTVWAGTESGPAYMSMQDTLWTTLAEMDSLVNRYITSVASMSDGSLWFGSKGGVSKYSFHGWTLYTTASGLAGDIITSITGVPRDVWIGTTTGVSYYDGEKWTLFEASDLPSAYVRVVYRRYDGTIWCGTSHGVAMFDGDFWRPYGTFDGLPAPGSNDFVEDWNESLWVATDGGVAFFSADEWHQLVLPEQVAYEVVTSLAADIRNGVLWIGTMNGVVMYIPGSVE